MSLICARTSVGGLLWRARQAGRITEKDTIVLADFTNTTAAYLDNLGEVGLVS
jgi:hypothetical protein